MYQTHHSSKLMVLLKKNLLQISVGYMQNDIILTTPQGVIFGDITVYGKVCIEYMSLRKYMPKYIKPMSNRNKTHVDTKHV